MKVSTLTRLAAWPAFLAALLLGGCAVGPRYAPAPTPPVAGFDATRQGASADTPMPDQWWRLYNDPTVNDLVQQALVHNTDLRVAEANLQEAQAVLREARSNRLPATNLSGSALYGRGSRGSSLQALSGSTGSTTGAGTGTGTGTGAGGGSGTGSGGDTGSGSGGGTTSSVSSASSSKIQLTYSAAFDVAYDLDLFGRLRRAIEAATADVEARRAAEDAVRVTVAADTTQAYVDACAYAAQANVARQSFALLNASYQTTIKQQVLGVVSAFEVSNARALAEQAGAAIPALEGQRRSSLYLLMVLTGRTPESIDATLAACARPPQMSTVLPVGDGAALLKRRPDVREAERNLAAATARIGVATADLYPDVSLGGSVAATGASAKQMVSSTGLTFGVGPLVSWTFPNLSVARARIAQSRAQTQATLATFDGTVLTALRETEQALAAYGAELDRHAALTTARDESANAFRLAQVRLQRGSISNLDLITVERTLFTAQSDLAASDQALADDQVAVFRALGGGWQDAPPVASAVLPSAGRSR